MNNNTSRGLRLLLMVTALVVALAGSATAA